nr:Wzz/FepE/Etk N-terminal domain-containing protein [Lysinibacillus timonensis]
MKEAVRLRELFQILVKRWLIIVSMMIGFGTIVAAVSLYVITPIYQSETQILVNQKNRDLEELALTLNVQNDLQLINTYNVIMKSPAILTKVIDELDLNMTTDELTKKITVTNADNSQVVNINVQDEQYAQAVEISNTLAEVFKEEIVVLMNVDNVNILSEAKLLVEPKPVKPNITLNVFIAVVFGLMIGVAVAFLLEFLDTTVKSEEDIEDFIGLPVMGFVGKFPIDLGQEAAKKEDKPKKKKTKPRSQTRRRKPSAL